MYSFVCGYLKGVGNIIWVCFGGAFAYDRLNKNCTWGSGGWHQFNIYKVCVLLIDVSK